jgi:rubrerythrin
MDTEIKELLETAIYKEIASEVLYRNFAKRTDDPGAAKLMSELADEEQKHIAWLKELNEKGVSVRWHRGRITDLKISEHLNSADNLEEASLQDTLIYAMKKEQLSIDFYSRMTGVLSSRTVKRICQKLVNEEIRHKVKLEILYDDLFLSNN